MKNLKNVLIVGAAVLLTAGAVGGVAYLTKGFTTADPISDLTKQGEVVQVLEKTVDPLTHLATYAIPTADVEAVSGGNIAVPFYLDDEDEFLSKTGNCPLFVATAEGRNIFDLNKFPSVFGLVIGNESLGVSQTLKKSGTTVSLPMSKKIESLNAAVSASVLMFLLSK